MHALLSKMEPKCFPSWNFTPEMQLCRAAFGISCGFTVVPFPPLVDLLSSRTENHIQNITIPVFHFRKLAMSPFAKNMCVCASVQHGLEAQFCSMQETGSCKTRKYEMLSNNGISAYPSFYVPLYKSKAKPLILDQN